MPRGMLAEHNIGKGLLSFAAAATIFFSGGKIAERYNAQNSPVYSKPYQNYYATLITREELKEERARLAEKLAPYKLDKPETFDDKDVLNDYLMRDKMRRSMKNLDNDIVKFEKSGILEEAERVRKRAATMHICGLVLGGLFLALGWYYFLRKN